MAERWCFLPTAAQFLLKIKSGHAGIRAKSGDVLLELHLEQIAAERLIGTAP